MLNAVEYIKESRRMCKSFTECAQCPVFKKDTQYDLCFRSEIIDTEDIDKAIKIVEQWAEEHPITTNKDKFKEVFGRDIQSGECESLGCRGFRCDDCPNKDFWNQEYKEPERSESE